jgi:hypothetical protein
MELVSIFCKKGDVVGNMPGHPLFPRILCYPFLKVQLINMYKKQHLPVALVKTTTAMQASFYFFLLSSTNGLG